MCEGRNLDDLGMLKSIRDDMYDKLKKEMEKPKVGDLLRVIEMKQKLSVQDQGEKKFWEMVNRVRGEELNKQKTKKRNKEKETK